MPVAHAGPDQLTQTLTTIALSGAGSNDPDGTVVGYAWAFGDGTAGAGMAPSKSYARAGTYTATLTVTDDRGATATDTAMVSVANRPPTASAGPDASTSVGTTIALSAAGSSDTDGSITSHAWTFGDGTSATGAAVAKAYAAAGTYTVTLTVTDNDGGTAVDTAVVTVGAAGTGPLWGVRAGGAGYDEAKAVALDAFGNLFVTGEVSGPVNLGTGTTCAYSIFVAAYSAAGTPLWARCLGGAGGGSGRGVAVDPRTGDLVVTGYFRGTVDFGGGPLASPDGYDVFLARYTAAGAHLWSQQFGSTTPSAIVDEAGTSVAVDQGGSIFLTGMFEGTANFGTGPLTSAGQVDAFLARYSANGVAQWAQRFGSTYADTGNALAVDANGNVVVTGTFLNPVDFGGGPITSSGPDGFLASYSPTGAHLWSRRFGGTLSDEGRGLAIDATGNVLVTGTFQNTIDFGGGGLTSGGGNDIFLAKLTGTGAHVWSKAIGGTSSFDAGNSVAIDGAGNVVLAGFFSRTVDFGTGAITSGGSKDAFVAKYSSAGAAQWIQRFGGTSIDGANAVTVDAGGTSTVAGLFYNSIDLGAGALGSAGDSDLFLLRLRP